jgi:hypothetical protein
MTKRPSADRNNRAAGPQAPPRRRHKIFPPRPPLARLSWWHHRISDCPAPRVVYRFNPSPCSGLAISPASASQQAPASIFVDRMMDNVRQKMGKEKEGPLQTRTRVQSASLFAALRRLMSILRRKDAASLLTQRLRNSAPGSQPMRWRMSTPSRATSYGSLRVRAPRVNARRYPATFLCRPLRALSSQIPPTFQRSILFNRTDSSNLPPPVLAEPMVSALA